MTKIITIDDIERGKKEDWKNDCKKEVKAQIILNKLNKHKVITKKQSKEVQDKITKLGKRNEKFANYTE